MCNGGATIPQKEKTNYVNNSWLQDASAIYCNAFIILCHFLVWLCNIPLFL